MAKNKQENIPGFRSVDTCLFCHYAGWRKTPTSDGEFLYCCKHKVNISKITGDEEANHVCDNFKEIM